MIRSSTTFRITAALASVTVCAVLAAQMVGLVPDQRAAISHGRKALVESLAVGCSMAAVKHDQVGVERLFGEITRRNPDVLSAGLRLTDGQLQVSVADHERSWVPENSNTSFEQLRVPLFRDGQEWAGVEVRFRPRSPGSTWISSSASVPFIVFVSAVSFLGQYFYVQRLLANRKTESTGEGGTSPTEISELEKRNEHLHKTLARLETSREQIRKHNEQLRILASFDPLTGCLNRRAFFEKLETVLQKTNRRATVSYLITDIDKFKSVNDRYGHTVGDEVLKEVGRLLKELFNNHGSVCRYGGEEFSILLPNTTADQATELAESFRGRLEGATIANISVTASIGVAQFDLASPEPHAAVELADQALYVAKRRGRNRVVRWDELRETDLVPGDPNDRSTPIDQPEDDGASRIPINAVSALSAALFHRDAETAEHSRRVAQLCAAVSRGLLSERERYILEVAALLHDIGKLGIPDEVLHKPGRLTSEEWNIMRTYENIGVVILENAFTCPELIEILRTCRLQFQDSTDEGKPAGDDIPLGARVLSIADAYDAMLQRRSYREAISQERAFEELRRSAGTQFDPALVERFIATVQTGGRAPQVSGITPRSALQLGMETEQLACALDAEDRTTLKVMAARIGQMATENDLPEIAELTDTVDGLVESDADWLEVLSAAVELLDTCRVAQWSSVADECLEKTE